MTASLVSIEEAQQPLIKTQDGQTEDKTFTLNEDLFITREDPATQDWTTYERSHEHLGLARPFTPYTQSEATAV